MLGERIILHLRFTNTPGQLSELAEEAVNYEIPLFSKIVFYIYSITYIIK